MEIAEQIRSGIQPQYYDTLLITGDSIIIY